MASDAIYQEVLKVQQAGKPVVVSMGNLAASGGYYISGCRFTPLSHMVKHTCRPSATCPKLSMSLSLHIQVIDYSKRI